jgi:hypothetical protein
MIYKVNGYNTEPTYFDEATNVNAKAEAEVLLAQKQAEVLTIEEARFSICATFVDGSNTTWRAILDSDPEDTVCQVFDTFVGRYTECANKTEAYALNEKKKEAFLKDISLDKVYEVEAVTVELTEPLN